MSPSILQEVDSKIAARQAVVAGPHKDKLGKLAGLLTTAGMNPHMFSYCPTPLAERPVCLLSHCRGGQFLLAQFLHFTDTCLTRLPLSSHPQTLPPHKYKLMSPLPPLQCRGLPGAVGPPSSWMVGVTATLLDERPQVDRGVQGSGSTDCFTSIAYCLPLQGGLLSLHCCLAAPA